MKSNLNEIKYFLSMRHCPNQIFILYRYVKTLYHIPPNAFYLAMWSQKSLLAHHATDFAVILKSKKSSNKRHKGSIVGNNVQFVIPTCEMKCSYGKGLTTSKQNPVYPLQTVLCWNVWLIYVDLLFSRQLQELKQVLHRQTDRHVKERVGGWTDRQGQTDMPPPILNELLKIKIACHFFCTSV